MSEFQDVFDRLSQNSFRLEDVEMMQLHTEAARHFEAATCYDNEGSDRHARYELELAEQRLEALEDVAGYRKRREGQGQV